MQARHCLPRIKDLVGKKKTSAVSSCQATTSGRRLLFERRGQEAKTTANPEKEVNSRNVGAISGAVQGRISASDERLDAIISRWNELTNSQKDALWQHLMSL